MLAAARSPSPPELHGMRLPAACRERVPRYVPCMRCLPIASRTPPPCTSGCPTAGTHHGPDKEPRHRDGMVAASGVGSDLPRPPVSTVGDCLTCAGMHAMHAMRASASAAVRKVHLGPLEDLLVLLGGMVPREVLLHAPPLQAPPVILVVPAQCRVHRVDTRGPRHRSARSLNTPAHPMLPIRVGMLWLPIRACFGTGRCVPCMVSRLLHIAQAQRFHHRVYLGVIPMPHIKLPDRPNAVTRPHLQPEQTRCTGSQPPATPSPMGPPVHPRTSAPAARSPPVHTLPQAPRLTKHSPSLARLEPANRGAAELGRTCMSAGRSRLPPAGPPRCTPQTPTPSCRPGCTGQTS